MRWSALRVHASFSRACLLKWLPRFCPRIHIWGGCDLFSNCVANYCNTSARTSMRFVSVSVSLCFRSCACLFIFSVSIMYGYALTHAHQKTSQLYTHLMRIQQHDMFICVHKFAHAWIHNTAENTCTCVQCVYIFQACSLMQAICPILTVKTMAYEQNTCWVQS